MSMGGNLVGEHESLKVRCWGHWNCDSRVVQVGGEKGSRGAKLKRYAHLILAKKDTDVGVYTYLPTMPAHQFLHFV